MGFISCADAADVDSVSIVGSDFEVGSGALEEFASGADDPGSSPVSIMRFAFEEDSGTCVVLRSSDESVSVAKSTSLSIPAISCLRNKASTCSLLILSATLSAVLKSRSSIVSKWSRISWMTGIELIRRLWSMNGIHHGSV